MADNISNHYKNQRYKREKFIHKYFGNDGEIIDSFLINKGHKNGIERHDITDNGIILIYNVSSNKLITKKIARPLQIKYLYDTKNKTPPKWLMEIAEWHESLHMNYL